MVHSSRHTAMHTGLSQEYSVMIAGSDEYALNVVYCCIALSIRVPIAMPQLATLRLGLEACHFIFLEAMNRRHGLQIFVVLRVLCRFALAMTVGVLMEVPR